MPRSLTVRRIEGRPGVVYYPLQLNEVPKPAPGPGELLIRLHAASLNHRDFFIRQHLYPGISFTHPLLSDGCGTVVEAGPGCETTPLLNKLVLLRPCLGWDADPEGPEDFAKYSIIGASKQYPHGAAQDYVLARESEVELCPEHLSPAEGAALPLVGLTGWRALVTKSGNAKAGRNIFVTGIGGGVALQVLQLGVAMGCNMYVSSGDEAKLDKAIQLGAKGGVNYKTQGWEKQLQALLPPERPYLDAIIDGAGGDIIAKAARTLKPGGVIANYGMTVGPKMDWSMQAVLRNIELKGTTMGSGAEFIAFLGFVGKHKIKPVISRTVKGLDNIEGIDGLFEDMKHGKQFGKLVIEID
ncbi:hypothetical protein F4820DRAFT_349764 [Hypoxylon rubiginosum]|uniref:Uncharacterized protein n=1 Tax=Hypoxylon rubiginosum TaxID=110542 RepID=A0ACB9YYB2_9PEZI|nr:hypothetical protein F4820DRAFT_349764 [Hypoxylon rubiginosum]